MSLTIHCSDRCRGRELFPLLTSSNLYTRLFCASHAGVPQWHPASRRKAQLGPPLSVQVLRRNPQLTLHVLADKVQHLSLYGREPIESYTSFQEAPHRLEAAYRYAHQSRAAEASALPATRAGATWARTISIRPTQLRDLADHQHEGPQWRPLDHLLDGTPLAGYTENESGRREVRLVDSLLDTTRGTKAATTVDTNVARRGVCTLTARPAQEPWLTIILHMATMACRAHRMLHTDMCRLEAMVATHPQWRQARQQPIPSITTHDRHS